MRKWAFLLLLAGWSGPVMAAKNMSVGQLDQLLDSLRGKSDGKVAQELSELELTERVSAARRAHWEAEFPGSKTREALTKLADLAAFLDPPAADVLPVSAPSNETQGRMLELAGQYVKTTITRLPNFIATRETTHFEDTPSQQTVTGGAPGPMGSMVRSVRAFGITVNSSEYKALHRTATYSTTVTYRDGMEVHDADVARSKNQDGPPAGLTTSGEFGPVLSVVMGDAMRGEITWQRWEQGAGDPVAVFRYAVPAEQSNYMVGVPAGGKIDRVYPAYHGEIAIDPATGAILRISQMAEMPTPYEAMQVAMLVEYAPVAIGEQSYICPVHGVAFSRTPVKIGGMLQDAAAKNEQMQLNDVVFTQYHVFRSEARMVNDDKGNGNAPQPPADATGAEPPARQP